MSDMLDDLDELDDRVHILENPLPPAPPVDPPPPSGTWQLVKVNADRAPAYYTRSNKGNGYPIMEKYEPHIYYGNGAILAAYPDRVRCDSGFYAWKLSPEYVPAGKPELYVDAADVAKV